MTSFEERMRRRIERESARVNRWIASLKRDPRPEEMEGAGDNTPLSEVTDATLLAGENEIRAGLFDWLIRRATLLEEARRRLDQGTFGLCVRCEGAIHVERLEALPEAALCLACQAQHERSGRVSEPNAFEWIEAGRLLRERNEFD